MDYQLERDNLLIGGYPKIVTAIEVTGEAVFKRGDVIAKKQDGSFVLIDSNDATEQALYGIVADDIHVPSGETKQTMAYVKGCFNQRYLNFGGSDTVEDHKNEMLRIGLIVEKATTV